MVPTEHRRQGESTQKWRTKLWNIWKGRECGVRSFPVSWLILFPDCSHFRCVLHSAAAYKTWISIFVRVSIFLPASWLSLFPDFSRFLTFPVAWFCPFPDFPYFSPVSWLFLFPGFSRFNGHPACITPPLRQQGWAHWRGHFSLCEETSIKQ